MNQQTSTLPLDAPLSALAGILPPLPWLLVALAAFALGTFAVSTARRLLFVLLFAGMITPAAIVGALSEAAGTAAGFLSGVDFASNLGLYGVLPLLAGGALALLGGRRP